eukprot:1508385-Prymnesium_polylepis.1
MDTVEKPIVISVAENPERSPVTPADMSVDAPADGAADEGELTINSSADGGSRAQIGVEEAASDAAAADNLPSDRPSESEEAAAVGVTVEAPEAASSQSGQLGVPKLTERFGKMVANVENGPKPSGDGKAVDQHTLQDLSDIDTT